MSIDLIQWINHVGCMSVESISMCAVPFCPLPYACALSCTYMLVPYMTVPCTSIVYVNEERARERVSFVCI